MRTDLLKRFTSRKFIAAAVAALIAVLSDLGFIDQSQAADVVTHATPLAYILVEGLLDLLLERPS